MGSSPQVTTTNQSQNQTYSQLQNLIENLATQGTSNQQSNGTTLGAQQQNTAQQQNPWAPAVPALSNLLGAVSNQGYGLTPNQQAALTAYSNSANNVPGFGQSAANSVNNLFNSNNGAPQAGMWNDALQSYQQTVAPFTNINNINPMTSQMEQYLFNPVNGVNQQIMTGINSEFSGAGRDPAGNADASKAAATAISQADLPYLLNQQNINTQNYLGTAQQAFGNTGATAQGTTGLLQTPLMNSIAAMQQAGNVPGLWTQPATTALGAANTAYAAPYANIQTPWNMVTQAAGLGGETTGTATGTQQQQTANAQQGTTSQTTAGSSQGNTSGTSQGTAQGTSTTTPASNPFMTGASLGLGLLALSDERAKENIEPVGLLNNGLNVYKYNFKGDSRPQIGVIAQEVEQVKPEAVHNIGMWKFVDYDKATQNEAA